MFDSNRPQKDLSSLKKRPILPPAIKELTRFCRPGGRPIDPAAILTDDEPLTARIVRLLNAPLFDHASPAASIEEAIGLAGAKGVRDMAVCLAVYDSFERRPAGEAFEYEHFRRHSLICAILAGLLARQIDYPQRETVFAAGLLHDIGKPVLFDNFPDQYRRISQIYAAESELLSWGESRLALPHGDLGARLLDDWGYDSLTADAVRYHHEAKSRILAALPLVQIIYVANRLSHVFTSGDLRQEFNAADIFELSQAETQDLIDRAIDNWEILARPLGLKNPSPPIRPRQRLSGGDHTQPLGNSAGLLRDALDQLSKAEGLQAILSVLEKGLKHLFDFETLFCFLVQPHRKALMGYTVLPDRRCGSVKALTIPAGAADSLVLEALHKKTPRCSFEWPDGHIPAILDEQLIRIGGAQGILCLSLCHLDQPVGVLVLGLDRHDFAALLPKMDLVTCLANQTAMALRLNSAMQTSAQEPRREHQAAPVALDRKIYHEVNNPLGIIKNYLKILALKLTEQKIEHREIRIINEEIDRISAILRKPQSAVAPDKLSREPVNINRLLADLIKLMQNSVVGAAGIDLHMDLDPSNPMISAETNSLKQVFINLINNAVESMQDGGNLHIQTRRVAKQRHASIPDEDDRPLQQVEIVIRDDGLGIPEAIRSRCFEPSVSTKDGDHLGIGLAIVKNILRELNGFITCDSKVGEGTSFTVTFPLLDRGRI